MKISRRQLRNLILEDDHVQIDPDSSTGEEIQRIKNNAAAKAKEEINTEMQNAGGALSDETDAINIAKKYGIEDAEEFLSREKYIETQSGGLTREEELKGTEFGQQQTTESKRNKKMKLTPNKIRNIILQELAELIIEPESPCSANQADSIPIVDFMGRPDSEGEMASKQLQQTADMSQSLAARLHGKNSLQLPSWVQAKITKAADYIQSVHNYLDDDL